VLPCGAPEGQSRCSGCASSFDSGEFNALRKQLINTPKILLDRDQCRWLGDAVFAFFCPEDAVILTTNIGDHQRLAKAVGKRAEKP